VANQAADQERAPLRLWRLAVAGAVAGSMGLLAAPAAATFPGQNGRIVFADAGHIASMNAAGSGRRQLTHGAGNADPAFSASGTRIVFSHKVGKHQVIDVMHADGTHKRALTRRHFDRTPAFAPSGKRIVFSRVIKTPNYQHSELFTVRSDGTHLTQLTHSKPVFEERSDQPSYAPNGKRIVYEALFAEDVLVEMINADGTRADFHQLDGPIEPSFAPSGKRILFNDFLESAPQLGTADLAGEHAKDLTQNQDPNLTYSVPSYSPDGNRIVFSNGVEFEGPTSGDIWVMNADGSGLTRLTNDGQSLAPDWGAHPVG
jgi:Tol biopolymer transport system component